MLDVVFGLNRKPDYVIDEDQGMLLFRSRKPTSVAVGNVVGAFLSPNDALF